MDASSITGVVLRGGGTQPLASVRVQLTSTWGRTIHTFMDGKGRFRVIPDSDARYEVTLVPLTVLSEAPLPRVTTTRGGPEVRLEVKPQSCLLLRRSFSSRLSGAVEVRVAGRRQGGKGVGAWQPKEASGLVLGAASGEIYDVLLRHPGSGQAGLLRGVSSDASSTFARMEPAAALRGRLELPPRVRAFDVEGVLTHGRLTLPVYLDEAGRF